MEEKKELIRVLYISPNGFLGGAEKFILNTAKNKKPDEFENFYLFFNDGRCRELVQEKVSNTFVLPFELRLRNTFSVIKAIFYIRKMIKERNIQIVHSSMPYAHILSSLATIGLKVKKVWFQHGPVGGFLDYLGNLFFSDVILFNSQFLKDMHNKMVFSKFKSSIQKIIPLGNEIPRQMPQKESKGPIQILSVGRISRGKGQLTLIRAASMLEKEGFKNFEVSIIGEANSLDDKLYKQELIDFIAQKSVSNIKFIGQVDNPEDFLTMAHILVHTATIPESFGLTVSEAMANGCLVIGANFGGVREILKDQQTGITFDSRSPDSSLILSSILKKILKTPFENYQEIVSNGHTLIRDEYSMSAMMSSLNALYRELI